MSLSWSRESQPAGSYLIELAEFLGCEEMIFLSLKAFCDESFGSDEAKTPWYVVGAYTNTPARWRRFEKSWRAVMARERIKTLGFHANECVKGAGGYWGIEERKRERIQHGLIDALKQSKPTGFVAAIDMELYRQIRPRITYYLHKPEFQKFNDPYVLAFKQMCQLICRATGKRKIGFVCHQRPKGRMGRAEEWYNGEAQNEVLTYATQLGPFAFDTMERAVGLHAADMIAYCAYRELVRDPTPWQWQALNDASHIEQFHYGKRVFDYLLETMNEEIDAREGRS